MHKSHLFLKRPVYVGMSILDLSKNLMYDFYYNEMKAPYGHRVKLLYTDTDSLLLEIHPEDIYHDMRGRAALYDTSDYPQDNLLYITANKKVLGQMKDGCSILETCGKNIKKAKGVKKAVVRKHVRHKQYTKALFEKQTFHHGMHVLRSEHQESTGST